MPHLSKEQEADMVELIHNFPCLFGDVPTCTTVLQHDIDVGDAKPIKQHPYRVNTMKRSVMKQEVAYLLEHHWHTRVQVHGAPRVCWFQGLIPRPVSARIILR